VIEAEAKMAREVHMRQDAAANGVAAAKINAGKVLADAKAAEELRLTQIEQAKGGSSVRRFSCDNSSGENERGKTSDPRSRGERQSSSCGEYQRDVNSRKRPGYRRSVYTGYGKS
jgi:hypothetical protein